MVIRTLDLLTKQQCADVRSVVHRLRPLWIQRHPWVPFYTLGAASYLDAADGNAGTYYNRAARYNPSLREPFQWLYDRLASILARELAAPVVYAEKLALPGFHVFLAARIFEHSVAPIHRDLQYQLLDWDSPDQLDVSKIVSFTMAIALPETGGGLNVWENQNHVSHIPYQTGSLVLLCGDALHQIAPTPRVQPGDERITLQGHGVLCRRVWHLYW